MDKILERFIFPVPRPTYSEDSFPDEMIWVPLYTDDTATAVEYHFPCLIQANGTARYIIIYFHRNAEDLGSCREFCQDLQARLDTHVLAVEYPGYGPEPSCAPTAEQTTRHAFAAFDFVRNVLRWPQDSIILFGASLGTGSAAAVAESHHVAGVVLVAPFLSVRDLCRDHTGPAIADMITNRFPNNEAVQRIKSPILFVHGMRDDIVPYRHGAQLYALFNGRAMLISPPNMGHNSNLLGDEWYLLRPMMALFHLPDYSFEHMTVPDWAFRRPKAGEVPEVPRPAFAPGPLPGSAPLPAGIKRLGINADALEVEDFDDAVAVVPPESDEAYARVPKTRPVRNQLLEAPPQRPWRCVRLNPMRCSLPEWAHSHEAA